MAARWAGVGREFEASASTSHRDIAASMEGRSDYDSLTLREQAMVRAEWTERIAARREKLDLAREFTRTGRSYVELDDAGNVVTRNADSVNPD